MSDAPTQPACHSILGILHVRGMPSAALARDKLCAPVVKISYPAAGREDNFKFKFPSADPFASSESAQSVADTIRAGLTVGPEFFLLEWVEGPADREAPHFNVIVPLDFDLEDLAELSSSTANSDAIFERYRGRYGSAVDRWRGMSIVGEWKLLVEDALFARMEKGSDKLSTLGASWVQEPPWGECEWLNIHTLKDRSVSNVFSPPVVLRLTRRDQSGADIPLHADALLTARPVLLAPNGREAIIRPEGRLSLHVPPPTYDTARAEITYDGMGITLPSQEFPSSRGMRAGEKRRRGA
jgi:hypothetical protein